MPAYAAPQREPEKRGGGETPDFDSSGPRCDLVRSVWRRLPRALAKPLGAALTKQLS